MVSIKSVNSPFAPQLYLACSALIHDFPRDFLNRLDNLPHGMRLTGDMYAQIRDFIMKNFHHRNVFDLEPYQIKPDFTLTYDFDVGEDTNEAEGEAEDDGLGDIILIDNITWITHHKKYKIYSKDDPKLHNTNLYGLYAYATQLEQNDNTDRDVQFLTPEKCVFLSRQCGTTVFTRVYVNCQFTTLITFGVNENGKSSIFFENVDDKTRDWLFKPLDFDYKPALENNGCFDKPLEICIEM